MNFRMIHTNFNVFDLDKSLAFYKEALGLQETHRIDAEDGSFIIIYLSDESRQQELELTWLRDRETPYDLGDQEFHICFETDNYEESFKHHEKMGCIAFINEAMGIYFITDPDGYWIEVMPAKK